MPFDYYKKLNKRQQRIYDASDAISRVELPLAGELTPLAREVERALEAEERARTQRAVQALNDALLQQLTAPPLKVRVLAARPAEDWGELQGLYEGTDGESVARVTVWMRTAKKKQVVRFRTFMRTYLHELCHHLDYTHHRLADSFHTEGFFKRESSLMTQIVGPAPPRRKNGAR